MLTNETTAPAIDLGDRVILAAATDRRPDALGTVVARDPYYPGRDVVMGVLHEDHVLRWRRRDALRPLGHRMSADDLVADLKLMGRDDLADRIDGREEASC